MEQVAALNFHDLEENCAGYAGVRASRGVVALAVSLEKLGDTEVFVTPQQARELASALENAARRAEGGKR